MASGREDDVQSAVRRSGRDMTVNNCSSASGRVDDEQSAALYSFELWRVLCVVHVGTVCQMLNVIGCAREPAGTRSRGEDVREHT